MQGEQGARALLRLAGPVLMHQFDQRCNLERIRAGRASHRVAAGRIAEAALSESSHGSKCRH